MASVFVLKVAGAAIGLASHFVVARIVGRGEYGRYSVGMATLGFLVLGGSLGLDRASLRYLPTYQTQAEPGLLRGYLAFARTQHRRVCVLVIVLGAAVLLGLRHLGMGPTLVLAGLTGAALYPRLRAEFGVSVLRAFDRFALSTVAEQLVRPLVFLTVVLVLYAAQIGSAESTMGAYGVAIFITAALTFVTTRREVAQVSPAAPEFSSEHTREWTSVGLQLLLVSGLQLIVAQSDVLMVGGLRGSEAAGVYAAASKIAGLGAFALHAMNAVLVPMIARLHAAGEHAELRRLVRRATLATFAATVALSVPLALAREPIMSLFGAEFLPGTRPMLVLLGGYAFSAAAGPVGFIMTMTGRQQRTIRAVGLAAVLNVALNAALIPRYGTLGAAVATASATLVWNVILFIESRAALAPDPDETD